MNKDAGRGNCVIVTVRLENGKKLPFFLDTGAEVTVLDKSLEPQLGKPKATGTLHQFGVISTNLVFAMPRLYIGDVLLRADTNSVIETSEIDRIMPGAPVAVKGILGMNILGNYCIQFDFYKSQIRFLKSNGLNGKEWGRPFPLYRIWSPGPVIGENLVGAKGVPSLVDTGFNGDGWLIPELFDQWTNQTLSAANGEFRAPAGALGGENYHYLDLDRMSMNANERKDPDINGIGIHVLSENLVTFDFPNKVMYLKRVSEWPLADRNVDAKTKSVVKSAFTCLSDLKLQGRLPGFLRTDKGMVDRFDFGGDFDTITIQSAKEGEPFIYYYTLNRKYGRAPWQLIKAWETDQNGNVFTNFHLLDRQK